MGGIFTNNKFPVLLEKAKSASPWLVRQVAAQFSCDVIVPAGLTMCLFLGSVALATEAFMKIDGESKEVKHELPESDNLVRIAGGHEPVVAGCVLCSLSPAIK